MLNRYISNRFITLLFLLFPLACKRGNHGSADYVFQYVLLLKKPLENYGFGPTPGKRDQDLPAGDTIIAESDSYLTGRPAYSKVSYKQQTIWVFDVLTKTGVLSKKKVKPIYGNKKVQNVIYN